MESRDNHGQTALLHAAARGYEAIVKLLLERGAGLETKEWKKGCTALCMLRWKGVEGS